MKPLKNEFKLSEMNDSSSISRYSILNRYAFFLSFFLSFNLSFNLSCIRQGLICAGTVDVL